MLSADPLTQGYGCMDVHTGSRTFSTGAAHPPGESPASPARTIVIVGAGFSGTAVAMNLLRLPQAQPLRVVLIEREVMARGTAYGRQHRAYLLNVPAGRMSASSTDPLEFLAFAQRRHPDATAADFLPRELYGEYLESALACAAQAAPAHVQLERIRGHVIAIEREHRGAGLRLHLENGLRLTADTIVLALGNPAPKPLPGSERLPQARYVADPWRAPPQFRAGETVLLVGTGLTMADIALAGDAAAQGRATIHAISRHGLIPAPQREARQVEPRSGAATLARAAAVSVRRLVRAVRSLAEDIEVRGGDWREAVTLVRNLVPALWQSLPAAERRRFLRHVRGYWEVHRHRLPERTWAALSELWRAGRLHVHAGRIERLETADRQVRVRWRARGARSAKTLLVDRVINCTGPDYDARHSRERLLRSLLAQGVAVADPLGLGIRTDERGALIDASGRVSGRLYYVGPMLRPRYWETTAVPELRVHAERLAWHLAGDAGSGAHVRVA